MTNYEPVSMSTVIVAIHDMIVEAVRKMAPIARKTLVASGAHIPTAILHTMNGLFPIILPYENQEQKKLLVEFVKKEAIDRHAFAVTTITNSSIVDCRTGEGEEALVFATSIQGGLPYVVIQKYTRNAQGEITDFHDILEGDEALIIGQMIIFPDWDQERVH